MRLSELEERSDALLFGAVVAGDLEDDGATVDCPILAMALELWRLTGSLSGVAAGLEAWRPGEPWRAWTTGSWLGWCALRPRVSRGMSLLAAAALVDASLKRRQKLAARAERLRRDTEESRAELERVTKLVEEAACSTNRG
jgi:hypothetical protein